jgi:hypothetical protein
MVLPPRQILRSGAPDAATTTADTGGVEVPYRRVISSEEEAADADADAEALLRGEQVDEEDEEDEADEEDEEDEEEVTQAKPQP